MTFIASAPKSSVVAWSPHVDVNRMNDQASIVLRLLLNTPSEKMLHETSVRILARFYVSKLRFDHRYVAWELTHHGTLGLIVEETATAIHWLWAVGFQDCQPRRLGMVK